MSGTTISPQVIGHGSQLVMGTATPAGGAWSGTGESTTPTIVAGLATIDFGSNKVDTIDSTDMGTPGTVRTYVPGLENPGDVSVKLNVKPGDPTQAALHLAKGGGAFDFKAIAPGTAFTRAFSAIVTSWDLSIPDDKLPVVTVKLQVTGPIVETNF